MGSTDDAATPLPVPSPTRGGGNRMSDTPSHSRGAFRPDFANSFDLIEIRGRREDRVRAAPAVSRARLGKETHTSIQVQRKQSGLPCAMVLRLIARSPR